jgi:hypothetical protein
MTSAPLSGLRKNSKCEKETVKTQHKSEKLPATPFKIFARSVRCFSGQFRFDATDHTRLSP